MYIHLHAGFSSSRMDSVLYTYSPVAGRRQSAAVPALGRAKNFK